ncbi:MAG: hypothetical protein P8N02_12680 [Actinomycetota bacterium]|nr:hypothetical protein [Actinomycetota bacterium]
MTRATIAVIALMVFAAACGDGDTDDAGDDIGSLLTRTGSATRGAAPFSFVQTLRTEVADGTFLEQRTEGVFDAEQDTVSIVVTSEGDATEVFTAGTTVLPGSTLNLVIADGAAFLRVDVLGLENTLWSRVEAGNDRATAEGTVAILGSGLVASVADGEQVGEKGSAVIGDAAVTHYRAPAAAADVSIYLPTETLNLLLEQGFRRSTVQSTALVDYWLDDEGRIRRVTIDHQPLIEELSTGLFDPGAEVTALRQTFEIVQFGGVEVEIPGPDEIAPLDE